MPQGMVEFDIDVAGDKQLHRALAGRIAAVEDLHPFFQRVADDFYSFERGIFAAEGAREGLSGWRALTAKYQSWKRRHYGGAGILVQSGALRDALTDPSAAGAIYEVSDDELRLGARRPTADHAWDIGFLHQKGTDKMPARPPLRLSKRRRSTWMRMLRDFVSGEA